MKPEQFDAAARELLDHPVLINTADPEFWTACDEFHELCYDAPEPAPWSFGDFVHYGFGRTAADAKSAFEGL